MANLCTWTGATDGDWSKTGNWLEGDVPDTGDTVCIGKNPLGTADVDINAGLNQSAVTVAELNIDAGYSGKIGTVDAYLQIGATICRIGEDFGPGSKNHSPRIKIDFGAVQTACTVFGSRASATETWLPPIRLIGTHASNTLAVRGGNVGVACVSGEAATFASLVVGADGAPVAADVWVGPTVTLTNVWCYRGSLLLESGAATLNVFGGQCVTERTGAYTAVSVDGGVFVSNSTGTITTLYITGGVADFLRSRVVRTVTFVNLYAGGQIRVDRQIVVLTNDIELQEPCTVTAVKA